MSANDKKWTKVTINWLLNSRIWATRNCERF